MRRDYLMPRAVSDGVIQNLVPVAIAYIDTVIASILSCSPRFFCCCLRTSCVGFWGDGRVRSS